MKKYLLLILFLVSLSSFSQNGQEIKSSLYSRNIITVSPLGIVNKVRVKYERALDKNFSIGTFLSYYYRRYNGLQIAPIGRFYFNNEAPNGFYIQLKALFSMHRRTFTFPNPLNGGTLYQYQHDFISYGGGFGLGYQILAGKNNNIVIDLGIGGKYMAVNKPDGNVLVGNVYNAIDNAIYYTTGPGSIFDGHVGVGIAF